MTITLTLSPEVVRRLEERAAQTGKTLEAYLQELLEKEARGKSSAEPSALLLSEEDFDRLLDELALGPPLPELPGDLSRADLYADHD